MRGEVSRSCAVEDRLDVGGDGAEGETEGEEGYALWCVASPSSGGWVSAPSSGCEVGSNRGAPCWESIGLQSRGTS